jgi:hypothetical protein
MIQPYSKKFWQVSPTQIRAKKRCMRYWCFVYAYGIRFTHPSAAFGSRVHDGGEALLKHGTPPDTSREGRVLRTGLQYLPKNVGKPLVEVSVKLPLDSVPGVVFLGFIDALWIEGPILIVQDWKTISNLRYAKSEKELHDGDLQFLGYSRAAMIKYARNEAQGLWIYMQTKGGYGSFAREPNITLDETEPAWHHINQEAREIAQWRADKLQIQDTPRASEEVCKQYGGCPYRHVCYDQWAGMATEKSRMSILDQLMADTQQQAPQQQVPTPAPAPVAQPAPVQQPALVQPVQQPVPVATPPVAPAPVAQPAPAQQPAFAQHVDAHYEGLIRNQPPLHPQQTDKVDDGPPRCVVCGLTDNNEKTWAQSQYVPEYPTGFIVHSTAGACFDQLKAHRKNILDGSIAPGTPMFAPATQPKPKETPLPPLQTPTPARELSPDEAATIAGFDDVNPPESAPPTVLQEVPAKETKAAKSAKKLTAKEQARYDAVFCAVIAAQGSMEPDPSGYQPQAVKRVADALWKELNA